MNDLLKLPFLIWQVNLHGLHEPNPCVPNANYILLACVLARFGHYRIALGIIGLRQGVALGPQGFLDTNTLVSPTRHACVGGLDQCEAPLRRCSSFAGI